MGKLRILKLLLLCGTVWMVSGCGEKMNASSQTAGASPIPAVSAAPAATPTPAPKSIQSEVTVFFGDQNVSKLIAKKKMVSYGEPDLKFAAAYEALKMNEDNDGAVPLFKGITFRDVDLKEDGLHLDISVDPAGRLGSPGEALFMQALAQTAFQFPEVKALYVLVDGNQVDSIMGHVDLPYPINRPK